MSPGTSSPADVEARLRADVERIRGLYPGDNRRQLAALIELLFLQYGERPGPARLVSLVAQPGSSPSTNTAADEIAKFWDKVRQRALISLPMGDAGLPQPLLEMFANLLRESWDMAVSEAAKAFETARQAAEQQIRDAEERAASALRAAEEANEEARRMESQYGAAEQARQALAAELASERQARASAEAAAAEWKALHASESEARANDQRLANDRAQQLEARMTALVADNGRMSGLLDSERERRIYLEQLLRPAESQQSRPTGPDQA